jgi:hypothetical protein
MYVVNLADSMPDNPVLAALVYVFFALITFGTPGIFVALWWMFRTPKFRGDAVPGTAQVTSLKRVGSMAINSLVPQVMCRIGLRVQPPGGAPYDVKIWKGWAPWAMDAIAPGNTVSVEFDSADPRKVRIGSSASRRSGEPVDRARTWVTADQRQDVATQIGQFAQRGGVGMGAVRSAADLLATGQRVMGALKSYAPTGTTPHSLGRTPSKPELLDAPHYQLVIELHFPNLAPIDARTVQPVPLDQVPNLAIGLPLPCAVDPANPQACVVDWDAITG